MVLRALTSTRPASTETRKTPVQVHRQKSRHQPLSIPCTLDMGVLLRAASYGTSLLLKRVPSSCTPKSSVLFCAALNPKTRVCVVLPCIA